MLGKVKTFASSPLRTRQGLSKCFLGGGCGGGGGSDGWSDGGVGGLWLRREVLAGEAGPWLENKGPVVFLPGESQGRGSLVGCHLWGCTESDTTEVT